MIKKGVLFLLIALSVGYMDMGDDTVKSNWWGMLYPTYSGCDAKEKDVEVRLKILDIIKNAPIE